MDVLALAEGLLHGLVIRNVGQNPQLDLAVVRIHQYTAGPGHEHFADLRPQVGTDRDVLQIGLRRGQPPGGGDQILEGGVNAAVGGNDLHEAVGIGALELGQHPVVHNGGNNGVLVF